MVWLIYQAQKNKQINKEEELIIDIKVKDFFKYFNLSDKRNYIYVKKWMQQIKSFSYQVMIEEFNTYRFINFFSQGTYINSELKLNINSEFTNHLLNLKTNKLFLMLNNLKKQKMNITFKFYQFIKSAYYPPNNVKQFILSITN